MSEVWRQGRARDEAVKVVKAMSPDVERAELRAALESELAARRLSESPLWYEQTLDHLHDTPVEQAQTLANGVRAAAGLGFRALRAVREQLVVSLGSERVGTLAPDTAAAYRAVMTAAEERDELPSISTRLTPRPERGGYLVEVQLPD